MSDTEKRYTFLLEDDGAGNMVPVVRVPENREPYMGAYGVDIWFTGQPPTHPRPILRELPPAAPKPPERLVFERVVDGGAVRGDILWYSAGSPGMAFSEHTLPSASPRREIYRLVKP